uniref:Uncharacterized protein n=1 Tax=Zea mays TaxID=4577 RepID=A0A804NQC4_MAIZE
MKDGLDTDGDRWTNQETLLLLKGIEKFNDNWNHIAGHVGTKSKAQCIHHFIRLPVADGLLENIEVPEASLPSGMQSSGFLHSDSNVHHKQRVNVRYSTTSDEATTPQEGDGVLTLISYDMDLRECTWGIVDVKINRQQSSKGKPLSKKQREWRLQTPFESLKLVRLDYRRMDEHDQYESVGLDDSLEDERNLDETMVD